MFIKVEGDPNQIVIEDRYWMVPEIEFGAYFHVSTGVCIIKEYSVITSYAFD